MFRLYYICEQTIRKTEKGEKQYKCSLKNSLEELLIPENECWKIQCKLPPKTKRFCPLKTFNNAP